MKNVYIMIAVILSAFYGQKINGQVTDYDKNVYNTVTIGTQTWTKENLKSLHYADGSAITGVYSYKSDSLVTIYGRLYSWHAATKNTTISKTQGVCPNGWHLPDDSEWQTLLQYLGGSSVAGGKIKETGTTHWNAPNQDATNSSGFTALPGGFYAANLDLYINIGIHGRFWESNSFVFSIENNYAVYNDNATLEGVGNDTSWGMSVRCILGDGAAGINDLKNNFDGFFIYPNPAQDNIIITANENAQLDIYNIAGKLIQNHAIAAKTSYININGLAKGVYVVKLTSMKGVFTKKLIKE